MPFVDNADFWEWLALNAGLVGLAAVPAQRVGDAFFDRIARWRRPEGVGALVELLRRRYNLVLTDGDVEAILSDPAVWSGLAGVIDGSSASDERQAAYDNLRKTLTERAPALGAGDADAMVMFLTSIALADMSFGDAVRGAQIERGLASVRSGATLRSREVLDELAAIRLGVELLVAATPRAERPPDSGAGEAEWRGLYLGALTRLVRRPPPWQPGSGLDELWLERKVNTVLRGPPTGRVRHGSVSWRAATDGVRIAAVLAPAGSGKTWALRSHLLRAIDHAISEPTAPLPVWTHAQTLATAWTSGRDVPGVASDLAVQAARLAGLEDVSEAAVRELRMHGMVLAVDGIDEVHNPTLRVAANEGLAAVGDWVRSRHDESQLLFASRPAGFENPVPDFAGTVDGRELLVELTELAPGEVEELFDRWCSLRGGDVARRRLRQVTSVRSALRLAVRVPLFAALCAWVAESDDVSQTRAALFDQVVDRFLERRWKSGEFQSPLGARLEDPAWTGQARAALAHVAGVMALDDAGWQEQIAAARCEALLAEGGAAPPPSGRTRLWSMCFEVGALTPLGLVDTQFAVPIGWIHRTFQRFLAAEYVIATSGPRTLVDRQVDEDWADTVVFASQARTSNGRHVDPTDLVLALLERCRLGRDPFGLVGEALARVLAESGASLQAAVARSALSTVRDRLKAGLIDPSLAGVLDDESGQIVTAMLQASFRGVEMYEGLLTTGDDGLALLERLIARETSADGAARALAEAAPDRAVTAVLERSRRGLLVASRDLQVLRGASDEMKRSLLDRYEAQPDQAALADLLAAAGPPEALDAFMKNLEGDQVAVRNIAVRGLGRLLSFEVPREVVDAVRKLGASDPDSEVRAAATTLLRAWQVGAPVALQADEIPQRPLPTLRGVDLIIGLLRGSREEVGIGLQLCLAKPELAGIAQVGAELDRLEEAVQAGHIEHDWVDALAKLRPAVNDHLLRHVQAQAIEPARHAAIAIPYLAAVSRQKQLDSLAAALVTHDDRWISTSFNVAADQAPEVAVRAVCQALRDIGSAGGYARWRLVAAGRRALELVSREKRDEMLALAEEVSAAVAPVRGITGDA